MSLASNWAKDDMKPHGVPETLYQSAENGFADIWLNLTALTVSLVDSRGLVLFSVVHTLQ